MQTDILDEVDYKNLLTAILRQAIDDYIKLVHPHSRRKKYLTELYLTAIDFIFDDEYRIETLKNSFNEEMSVEDLIGDILDTDRKSIGNLRKYVIQQAKEYWETKQLAVIDHIPDTVFIAGHTFDVQHDDSVVNFKVSEEEHTITLNKKYNYANQVNFFRAVVYTTALLSEIPVRLSALNELADEMFTFMKANNCFSYVGTGSPHTTPQSAE